MRDGRRKAIANVRNRRIRFESDFYSAALGLGRYPCRKDIENRSPSALLNMQSAIGQRIYVHVGATVCSAARFETIATFMRSLGVVPPERKSLLYGGVIGSVFVEDFVIPAQKKGFFLVGDSNRTLKSPWMTEARGSCSRTRGPANSYPPRVNSDCSM